MNVFELYLIRAIYYVPEKKRLRALVKIMADSWVNNSAGLLDMLDERSESVSIEDLRNASVKLLAKAKEYNQLPPPPTQRQRRGK